MSLLRQSVVKMASKLATKLATLLRKVALFAAWSFRKRWRVIHHGLDTVLRRTGSGDEARSLEEACPFLGTPREAC